jgi:hypothetical protein
MGVVNPEVLYMAGSAGARVTRRRGQGFRDFSEGMANINKVLTAKRAKYDALKAEFPEGIDRQFINEDVRSQLTAYVTSEKEAYNNNIKIMKRFPSFTKKYKNAVEENNKIKAGMTKVNEDLMYAYNAGIEAENIKLADGTLPELEDDHLDLANGDIWQRGFRITREGVDVGDVMTGENGGVKMFKPITDVKVGKAASTKGSDAYNALSAEILQYGISGGEMSEGMQKYYGNKVRGMLDNLTETELRHFYFNGMNDDYTNESSAAYAKLMSMGYERMEVPDQDVDPDGYARAIANNEEYNKQLDILKYSNNLSTPELRTQLMNTLLDVHKSGKSQFDAKERKNDQKMKMRGQVTQKEFFTKVPQELWANPDKPDPDVAIGINEILTRKGKFDEQAPFQGQFYFYAYDPVLKRYLQFKNAEEYQKNIVDGKIKGGKPISNRLLIEQERLDETGQVNVYNYG